MKMKLILCTVGGVIGGVLSALFGGWSFALTALVILMGMDYLTGLVVAGVFHASPKSEHGGLESMAGLKGLIRKVMTLLIVAVSHLVDRLIGVNYIMEAVTVAFCVNEIISILENAGLMGLPIPAVLTKALDVLRRTAEPEHPPDKDRDADLSAVPQNDKTEGNEDA